MIRPKGIDVLMQALDRLQAARRFHCGWSSTAAPTPTIPRRSTAED